jgi:hypothetical protein
VRFAVAGTDFAFFAGRERGHETLRSAGASAAASFRKSRII